MKRARNGSGASFNLNFLPSGNVYLSSVVKVDLSRPVVSNINFAKFAPARYTCFTFIGLITASLTGCRELNWIDLAEWTTSVELDVKHG